jgi:hypothetical protein
LILVLLWGILEFRVEPLVGIEPAKPSAPQPSISRNAGQPTATPPRVEIGLVLGADKGSGIDSIVDCKKLMYTCLSQGEVRKAHQPLFSVGAKRWG